MNINSPVKIWRSQKKVIQWLGKEGVIESFTLIRVPPLCFENEAPYPVVLVKIGGEKIIGQLVDCNIDEVKIGLKVKATLRKIKDFGKRGVIQYGIKFIVI